MKNIEFSVFNDIDCDRRFSKIDFKPYVNHRKLICGALIGFDKGTIKWINKLNRFSNDFFFLSEVTGKNEVVTAERVNMPFMCTPSSLAKEIVISDVFCSFDIKKFVHVLKNPLLRKCMRQMMEMYPRICILYAIEWVCFAERFIKRLIKELKPKEIYLWNIYYPFHRIIKHVAEINQIPVKCVEFGCIPGTIAIDDVGQQGEAFPYRKKELFSKNRVSSQMLRETQERLDHIYRTGENRNSQEAENNFVFIENKENNYKNILFLGCNDLESTFMSSDKKKTASSLFSSSGEAYKFVKNKCKKNKWTLKYKPHPIEVIRYGREIYDENYVSGNINWIIDSADLVITPFSQCAYVSMIRGVPVILLGFSELSGTGAVYEVDRKYEFESTVKIALDDGITTKMKENFLIHVARMINYYLYEING